jgi:hypothetical protein
LGGVVASGSWIDNDFLFETYVRGAHEGHWPDNFTSLDAIEVDEWPGCTFDDLPSEAWPAAALISTVTAVVLRELMLSGDVRVLFRSWDTAFDLVFESRHGSASDPTDPCRTFLVLPFGTTWPEDSMMTFQEGLGLTEQQVDMRSDALELVAQSAHVSWLVHGGSCPKHPSGVFGVSLELLADFVVDWAVEEPDLKQSSEPLREQASEALVLHKGGVRAALAAIGSPTDPVSVARAVSAKASAILASGDLGQVGFVMGLKAELGANFQRGDHDMRYDGFVQNLVLEDDQFRDSDPKWSALDEATQVLIVEQLIRVMNEHPAWLPLALIARHEGTKPRALTLVAGSAAEGVVEALDMNHSATAEVRAFAVLERTAHGVRDQ